MHSHYSVNLIKIFHRFAKESQKHQHLEKQEASLKVAIPPSTGDNRAQHSQDVLTIPQPNDGNVQSSKGDYSVNPINDTNVPFSRKATASVTVIVPAFNEESVIDQTLNSLKTQTINPQEIIVVDDFSTDRTGEVAKSFSETTVVRPPKNTGSKAGAQSFALPYVNTKYTIAIDADTTLADDAIEKMVSFMDANPEAVAASTFVLPKKIKTLWERGRFIEYMFIFPFYKRVQDWYGKPLISSGCFSIYNTVELKAIGGWSARTMAEDMDLTWSFYEKNKTVRFNHDVYCFPLEPESFTMMSKQLKRWSHGWVQNLKLHWQKIKKIPVLKEQIIAILSDTFVGASMIFVILPILAFLTQNPWIFLLGLVSDMAFIAVPVIWKGLKTKRLLKVLTSLPSFYVLRFVNIYFLYKAFILELLLKRSLSKYEKGH